MSPATVPLLPSPTKVNFIIKLAHKQSEDILSYYQLNATNPSQGKKYLVFWLGCVWEVNDCYVPDKRSRFNARALIKIPTGTMLTFVFQEQYTGGKVTSFRTRAFPGRIIIRPYLCPANASFCCCLYFILSLSNPTKYRYITGIYGFYPHLTPGC